MRAATDFSPVADLIPDDAIPLSCLRIVRVLDADGDEAVFFHIAGSAPLSSTIGMLDLAKFLCLREYTDKLTGDPHEPSDANPDADPDDDSSEGED